MRHTEQSGAFQIARTLELAGQPWRADREQVGRKQWLSDQARPFAVAELDAAVLRASDLMLALHGRIGIDVLDVTGEEQLIQAIRVA